MVVVLGGGLVSRYTGEWSTVSRVRCQAWFTAMLRKLNAPLEARLLRDMETKG